MLLLVLLSCSDAPNKVVLMRRGSFAVLRMIRGENGMAEGEDGTTESAQDESTMRMAEGSKTMEERWLAFADNISFAVGLCLSSLVD